MIIFHLVYIGDKYPDLKRIVYTFHMPAFLIISGYLANTQKNIRPFLKGMLWIFIPYAVMEMGYVIMSAILPVREVVPEVTPYVLAYKTLIAPMGPYWYLHTLILCSIAYYIVYQNVRLNKVSRLIVLGLFFFVLSDVFNMLSFCNAVYFMVGIVIHQSKQSFINIFQPSALAIIPLILLCWFPENWNRATLAGFAITYLAISSLLFAYRYLPDKAKIISHFIGRNTFSILLFSPIFTILAKVLVPFFAFDPSGICFILVVVPFAIAGCIAITWVTDHLRLSRFCFGKERALQ